jgi:hypothetical protein
VQLLCPTPRPLLYILHRLDTLQCGAGAIQACLAKNDYQEKKCLQQIVALIQCCDAVTDAPAPKQCSFSKSYRKTVAAAQTQQQQ